MKKIKSLILTAFAVMLFCLCFNAEAQAAMSDSEVKSRLSSYSSSYVKTKDGICYLEYPKWDASEEKMYEVISGIAESLMGEAVEDYCRVNIKFFFTHAPYGSDFQGVFDKLSLVKKKFGNFFTEWSRYNKLTMSVTSYEGGKHFSANFSLQLNGSEQDKDIFGRQVGRDYDAKLLSLVKQAQQECDDNMAMAQFFLRWLDENATYVILTGYTNDPRYALIEGKTVCGGYANAFKDLCNAAGIPAIVPVNMEANHAWSQVYLNGKWYTADLCNVVKSKSGSYNGYLFLDPDLSADCSDFVEKHKKAYVESFRYRNTVSLSSCSFDYKKSFTYTGKSITPALTVKFGGKVLTAGKDYKITYMYNKYPGTARMILEGVSGSGFRGSKTLTFRIDLPKVKVTATAGKTSVKLSWTKAQGADRYIVRLYNSKTDSYEDVAKVKGTSYTVKNLSSGKKYKLAVRVCVEENGNVYRGDNSKLTVITLPGKLKNLRASTVKDTSVKLKWTAMDIAEKYEVQISSDGKEWKKYAEVKSNYCTVKKLSANKRYYFRVRALSEYGKGSFSDKKAVTTLLARPEIEASAGKKKITVSWEKVSGAKGYVVYSSRSSDMMGSTKLTVKNGKTKGVVKNLKAGKSYYVRVRAYKTVSGERVYGAYSSVVRVKTPK